MRWVCGHRAQGGGARRAGGTLRLIRYSCTIVKVLNLHGQQDLIFFPHSQQPKAWVKPLFPTKASILSLTRAKYSAS